VVKEEGDGEGDETMAAARGRSRLDPACVRALATYTALLRRLSFRAGRGVCAGFLLVLAPVPWLVVVATSR
jgi:hypothetical protein